MLQAANNIFVTLPPYLSYYMNLHQPKVIKKLRYHFAKDAIIYGIRCRLTDMIYIGSTNIPRLRFHSHLVSGNESNDNLQAAIEKHGLSNFVVYVFEVVTYPEGLSKSERKYYLTAIKQRYIDHFPKIQLYNRISSSAR